MFCRSRNQGGSSFGQGYRWSCTTWDVTVPRPCKYMYWITNLSSRLGHFRPWSGSCFSCIWLHLIAWTSTSYCLLQKLGCRSCNGTTSSSSTMAHVSRCWPLRCGQLRASCAKFLRRSMKAASRSSKPGRAALAIGITRVWWREVNKGTSHWYNTEYYNVLDTWVPNTFVSHFT